jgi:hypothetical protein
MLLGIQHTHCVGTVLTRGELRSYIILHLSVVFDYQNACRYLSYMYDL